MRHAFGCLFMLVLLAAAALFARDYFRSHPQDLPWTELDLQDPVGAFTGRKLAALGDDPAMCRALLERAETADEPAPPVQGTEDCGYSNGISLSPEGRALRYAPGSPVTSCPVAAALFVFEEQVVQPAARRHLGSEVAVIEHAGSYSCRRLYGRAEGPFSEHATANAIDLTAFRLENGRRIHVLGDWNGDGPESAFLRDVRDGACDLFATVLSPDYNQAHADHLHLDQANRGRTGWSLCR